MAIANVVNTPMVRETFLWLLTFEDSQEPANVTLRAVNNLEDVTSRGDVYTAFPFQLTLPPDDGQKPQSLKLVFSNVGRELMQLVREYAPGFNNPKVKLELVLASAPDTVEKLIDFMEVSSAEYDAKDITFTLSSSSIFARKTCTGTYNQVEFPSLFWSIR